MTYEQATAMLKGYRANVIGDWCDLFDLAIEALEKQIPTKPNYYDGRYFCAECGDELETYLFSMCISYCSSCGKAHDWSEV